MIQYRWRLQAERVNLFRRNLSGKMSLNLQAVCMEVVAVITPVTYQMCSQVLGFLGAQKTNTPKIGWSNGIASANTATVKPFLWQWPLPANRTVNILFLWGVEIEQMQNFDETWVSLCHIGIKQEAQLSQRDRVTLRVIEYFAKSFKITQDHSLCESLLVCH